MIVQYEALYSFIIHILSGTKIFVGSNIFLIWNQYLFELKYTMIWSLRYIFDVWQSEHACEVLTLHQHVLRIFDFEWFRTRSNATIKGTGIHLFTFQKGMNWYYYRIFQHNHPIPWSQGLTDVSRESLGTWGVRVASLLKKFWAY